MSIVKTSEVNFNLIDLVPFYLGNIYCDYQISFKYQSDQ